jgi:signal peptide peptidase SppA
MPIPKPGPTEDEDTFLSRCMGDETMLDDWPDEDQRFAICQRQWNERDSQDAADGTTLKCWSNHVGIWAIEPLYFQSMVAEYRAGRLPVRSTLPSVETAETSRRRPYDVESGVAVIPILGPMSKGGSPKFDEVSTRRTQYVLRQAARDEAVRGILLHIDSPGGHVAGVQELADELYAIRSHKPTWAHIDDLGASAAYWVGSQTARITANATAEIGSIGTMAVLEDRSKRFERLGITVHVLATGPYKGLGVEGAPLTAEALAYMRSRVEAINRHFLRSIERGRGLAAVQVAQLADGRVHMAADARRLGLIDHVQGLSATIEEFTRFVQSSPAVPGAPRPVPRPSHHLGRHKLALLRRN